MSALTEIVPEFIKRADAYAQRAGISRATTSKKLFGGTRKLDDLAIGRVDVGVARLREAVSTLEQMERELDEIVPRERPPDQVGA